MKHVIAFFAVIFAAFPAIADNAPQAAPAPASEAPAKPFLYIPKPTDIVMGSEGAKVTVVEYASLSCPHCAHYFNETMPQIKEKYVDTGKVRFVYRDYPINAPALKAALLVQCADKDSRHEFLTVLFKTQAKWAFGVNFKDALANIAMFGGLDRTRFDACMTNTEVEKQILEVAKQAGDSYKVSATPTFFVGATEYKGNHDVASMSQAIEEALAQAQKK